jgi:hypothetical protein
MNKVAQRNGNILGYFLFKQIYYILSFNLNKQFQNMVYCRYLKVLKSV